MTRLEWGDIPPPAVYTLGWNEYCLVLAARLHSANRAPSAQLVATFKTGTPLLKQQKSGICKRLFITTFDNWSHWKCVLTRFVYFIGFNWSEKFPVASGALLSNMVVFRGGDNVVGRSLATSSTTSPVVKSLYNIQYKFYGSFQNSKWPDIVELACPSHLHKLKECKNRSFGDTSSGDMMSAFMGHHMRAVCTVNVSMRMKTLLEGKALN